MYSDLNIALASERAQEARRLAERQSLIAAARGERGSRTQGILGRYFGRAREQAHQHSLRGTRRRARGARARLS